MSAELSCKSCTHPNLIELTAETCLLFPGLKGLEAEPIFAFPAIRVCAGCGFIESRLSDGELQKVREGAAKLGIRPLCQFVSFRPTVATESEVKWVRWLRLKLLRNNGGALRRRGLVRSILRLCQRLIQVVETLLGLHGVALVVEPVFDFIDV